MNIKWIENSESILPIGFTDRIKRIFEYENCFKLMEAMKTLKTEEEMDFVAQKVNFEDQLKNRRFFIGGYTVTIGFLIEITRLSGQKPFWFYQNLPQNQFENLLKGSLGHGLINGGILTRLKPYLTQIQKDYAVEALRNFPHHQKYFLNASDSLE